MSTEDLLTIWEYCRHDLAQFLGLMKYLKDLEPVALGDQLHVAGQIVAARPK